MNTEWITDRKPRIDELQVVFKRGGYIAYGGEFLTWNGKRVDIGFFEKPPRDDENGGGYYDGYWRDDKVEAWMPLPDPPKKKE